MKGLSPGHGSATCRGAKINGGGPAHVVPIYLYIITHMCHILCIDEMHALTCTTFVHIKQHSMWCMSRKAHALVSPFTPTLSNTGLMARCVYTIHYASTERLMLMQLAYSWSKAALSESTSQACILTSRYRATTPNSNTKQHNKNGRHPSGQARMQAAKQLH